MHLLYSINFKTLIQFYAVLLQISYFIASRQASLYFYHYFIKSCYII